LKNGQLSWIIFIFGHLDVNPEAGAELFFIDRQTVGANVDTQALRLLVLLIELITHDGDDDQKRADDEIEGIVATHDLISFAA
jgi:hypothetical protein